MSIVYTLGYLLAAPLVLPWLLYRMLAYGKYRESFLGMTGLRLPRVNPGAARRTFWIHAVSVGEVNAAAAMVREIKGRFADARVVLSTITETGQAHARKTLGKVLDDVFYYPLDFPPLVALFLRRVRPTHYILMETELWPNMLVAAARRGVKIFMFNGKVSARSFRRYMRFRWLFAKPLAGVGAFCMQTRTDAGRMIRMCRREGAVFVTGNCKFDAPMKTLNDAERAELRRNWKIAAQRPVIVAGSTHPGEEEIVLDAFQRVKRELPEALLLLAPRHPERFGKVRELLRQSGLPLLCTSQNGSNPERPDVVLLDEMGKLQAAYGLGTAAIVAGSFTPVGGHNLLEAAVHRIPVIYGPHMHKQPEITQAFEAVGGGLQTAPAELAQALLGVLTDPRLHRELADKSYRAVLQNQGSARRNLEILLSAESNAADAPGA